MKKFKWFVVLIAFLFLPFAVLAEEGENEGESTEENTPVEETAPAEEQSNEVKIYLFRGEGCPHCQEAEEWFNSIEEEYGHMFKVIDYETWYNEDNSNLMQKVAKVRGEDVQGVPYIIIGNQSWNGFAETYEEEILDKIKSEFETNVDDRYDVMNYLDSASSESEEEESGNDALSIIIVISFIVGIGFTVWYARTKSS